MNQFRPHTSPRPTFEGYYSKFDLPSRGHLALIICSVPQAASRQHMISFTYVPPSFPNVPVLQRELWVENIEMINAYTQPGWPWNRSTHASHEILFELRIPSVGGMKVYGDDATEYSIVDPDGSFSFSAHVPGKLNRTPWSRFSPASTPEGLLVHLPLPLHWHVHTLSSTCTFHLSVPGDIYSHVHPLDTSNAITSIICPPFKQPAYVHQEKNWAHSFPSSHIWIQARNHERNSGINVAGGSIVGTEAFLISYHGIEASHDVSFTPPYAMQPSPLLPWPLSLTSGLSPTMSNKISWADRTVELTVTGFTRRISIQATAPENTFIGLSAPFHDGHRKNYLAESFRATIEVKVYAANRLGLGHWEELCMERFEQGSLEFGADWYGAKDKGKLNES